MDELIIREMAKINTMGILELSAYEERLKYSTPKVQMTLMDLCEARRQQLDKSGVMVERSDDDINEYFQ